MPTTSARSITVKMKDNDPLTVAQTSFFDLPAEIRNRIYDLALKEDEPIDLQDRPYIEEPALLMTRLRIRSEALAVFYGVNTFTVHKVASRPGRFGTDVTKDFLRSLGPERAALIRLLRPSTLR